LNNSVGRLNNLDATNAADTLLDTRALMDRNKAWTDNRYAVLTPATENTLLKVDKFTDIGLENASAIKRAEMGPRYGFNLFKSMNMPQVTTPAAGTTGGTIRTGAINNAAGYPAGTTSFTVDGLSAAITAGTFITIAGDDTPLQVVSTTGGATPTAIVTYQASKHNVADNAVVTIYNPGAVNGTFSIDSITGIGYSKEITIDGITVAPQVGQMVTFGSDNANVYGIIEVNGLVGIVLDRPLVTNLADNATVNFGPSGSYNFVFHPNALTLVTRPMQGPRPGTGALSTYKVWDSISVRVTIAYLAVKQGHLVTVDFLTGVKVLDSNLGAVMLG
jgi:hypothetical protein